MKFVIALDFGYTEGPSEWSSIDDLWTCAFEYCMVNDQTVILAQSETYRALQCSGKCLKGRLHEISVEQSGSQNGGGLKDGGTYFVLKEAARMLRQDLGAEVNGALHESLEVGLIAHSLHAKRAVRQGRLHGLKLTPIPWLPTELYGHAAQWWCRKRWLWYIHELIGYPLLMLARQI